MDLVDQRDKPVACVALVRRALQNAGFPDDARDFTEAALSGSNDEIFSTARRFVTVLSEESRE